MGFYGCGIMGGYLNIGFAESNHSVYALHIYVRIFFLRIVRHNAAPLILTSSSTLASNIYLYIRKENITFAFDGCLKGASVRNDNVLISRNPIYADLLLWERVRGVHYILKRRLLRFVFELNEKYFATIFFL